MKTKYYSLFYTASPESVSKKSSGFGVRTVTEGTPQELIDLLNDSVYNSYSSGLYQNKKWQSEPSTINDFPKRYYFRNVGDGKWYVFGRAAYAGYDFPFYEKGNACRPGNYITNMLVFDQWPGKDVFSLLLGGDAEHLAFRPADCSPRLDNEEMLFFMKGKPQLLPVEEKPLAKIELNVPKESVDLFFSYLESIKTGLPLVVKIKDEAMAKVCVGFLSLLADNYAKEATYELNYQGQGYPKNCAVTFINEYYSSQISPVACTFVDFITGKRNVTEIETRWRKNVEQEIEAAGLSEELSEWVYSSMASDNVSESEGLNSNLFNYKYHPDRFGLDIPELGAFLKVLSRHCKAGQLDSVLLNSLVSDMFMKAESVEAFGSAFVISNMCKAESLLDDITLALTKDRFAKYLNSSVTVMSKAVVDLDKSVFADYLLKDKFPHPKEIVRDCIQEGIGNTYEVSRILEASADRRVKNLVELAQKYPAIVEQVRVLLDKDSQEAAKVDYIREFASHKSNTDFGVFFFRQLASTLGSGDVREKIRLFDEYSQANTSFAKYLFNKPQVHEDLYQRFEKEVDITSAKDRQLIEKSVLDLLPEDAPSRGRWALLRNVLAKEIVESDGAKDYYKLAMKLHSTEAVKKVAPKCFEVMTITEIPDFIKETKEFLTEEQVLEYAQKGVKGTGNEYLKQIAIAYKYDYDRILAVSAGFGLKDKDKFKKFMKENFASMWNAHAVKGFFSGLFSKSDKKTKEVKSGESRSGKEKSDKKRK